MAKVFRSLVLALTIMAQVSPADDIHKVVLTYQGRENVQGQELDIFTVGKDRNILFGLAPLDQQPPLSRGDIQICQTFTQSIGVKIVDGKEYGDFRELGFLCGGRRYLFTHLEIR
jgi:hypothetical protein